MKARPYQIEALDALDAILAGKTGNPVVVIPTGGGKSILMAWAIQRWQSSYPLLRVCILAHRKELVQQNADELRGIAPELDIGIFSAGLNKRENNAAIIYASIDTAYNKAARFRAFHVIIVDEAHRVPLKGRGKYRSFLGECWRQNQNLRIVGFTATPYRMEGPLCRPDHLFTEICYEANVAELIRDGYLCRLRSTVGDVQPDLSKVKKSAGDYQIGELSGTMSAPGIVRDAVRSAVARLNAEERNAVMWFCVDVEHCEHVANELRAYGSSVRVVTGHTPATVRDAICEKFKRGEIRHLVNINVYTEGFNAKCVDALVLLRPTMSKGLYIQMVGRGLRLYPAKSDCLVLDYARCIDEHGPIDCIEAQQARLYTCAGCDNVFSAALGACPACGEVIPPGKREAMEREETERKRALHERHASSANILGSEPQTLNVDAVTVHRHTKPGKPDSLRVHYQCGLQTYREWICLDHSGPAQMRARKWWRKRFPFDHDEISTNRALDDLFLASKLAELTDRITVQRNGQHWQIIGHKIDNKKAIDGV